MKGDWRERQASNRTLTVLVTAVPAYQLQFALGPLGNGTYF